jgi:SulP family sulfate permease
MSAIDSTGLQALENLADNVHASGRKLILCGAREQPSKRPREAEFHDYLGSDNICRRVAKALDRAKVLRLEVS